MQGVKDRGQGFVEQGEVAYQHFEFAEKIGLGFEVGVAAYAVLAGADGPCGFDQGGRSIHADGFDAVGHQATTQPAFAATDVQHALGFAGEDGAQDGGVGDQAAAFDAPLAHGGGPGVGVGLPAEVELFSVVALHALHAKVGYWEKENFRVRTLTAFCRRQQRLRCSVCRTTHSPGPISYGRTMANRSRSNPAVHARPDARPFSAYLQTTPFALAPRRWAYLLAAGFAGAGRRW